MLINDNLEAMAKQLYDYWFVQFDFPNEEGKPYKSSGGAMVWNEELHMNIPYSWNTCLLNDYIGSNNTGDWGFDEPAEKRNMKVGCIRGADIVKLNDLPTRYIKDSNTSKLLSVWDIVIEVSGGSPTQATGRSAFVTPGVLKRNGGNLTCSNFCHAFTMKNYKASAYFFFMWRMFYDNNNMFNYEGKTSGIKNFMTDTFLANKWLDVPTALLDLFFERIKVIYEQIDNNIEEINALTKQRDELLPLLMNGQATVNYHLSASTSISFDISVLFLNFTNGNSLYETISLDYQCFALPLHSKENTHGTIQEDKRHIQQRQRQGDKHARERFLAFFYKCTSTVHQAAFGNAWCYRGYKCKDIFESK